MTISLTDEFQAASGLNNMEVRALLHIMQAPYFALDDVARSIGVTKEYCRNTLIPAIRDKLDLHEELKDPGYMRRFNKILIDKIINQGGLAITLSQEDLKKFSALAERPQRVLRMYANGYTTQDIAINIGYASHRAASVRLNKDLKKADIHYPVPVAAILMRAHDVYMERRGLMAFHHHPSSPDHIPQAAFEKMDVTLS